MGRAEAAPLTSWVTLRVTSSLRSPAPTNDTRRAGNAAFHGASRLHGGDVCEALARPGVPSVKTWARHLPSPQPGTRDSVLVSQGEEAGFGDLTHLGGPPEAIG